MKKYVFIITIFFVCFIQNIHASESSEVEKDTGLLLDYYRHYICYEFGISNIVTICIAEGDSICDVFIYNEHERIVSTTCPKTPILKWAFNIMPNESSITSPIRDNDYKPYYYKLSLINCGRQIILSSTLPFYNHTDVSETQIEDLKSFMIQLWYSNCIINSDNRQKTEAFLTGSVSGMLGSNMPLFLENNGGLPVVLSLNEGGGDAITPTKKCHIPLSC